MMIPLVRKNGASKSGLYSASASVRTVNQKRQRAPGCLDGVVAVTAQLDMDAAFVIDFLKLGEDFGEINLALAEHQVIVDAAAHVFDVNVPQPLAPMPQMHSNGRFS